MRADERPFVVPVAGDRFVQLHSPLWRQGLAGKATTANGGLIDFEADSKPPRY